MMDVFIDEDMMDVIIDKDRKRALLINSDETCEIRILDADIDIEQVDSRHSDYIVNLKFKADKVIFE